MRYDIAIIGGGIVGVATATALARRSRCSLIVVEAEDRLGTHQTAHSSGVIHSGLYYQPGSLKARLCVEGRRALYHFCQERGITHERCGKLVVATNEAELNTLATLEERGRANGLEGLRRLGKDELCDYEPHVRGMGGLLVPDTGIVDFSQVTRALADEVSQKGHRIQTGARVYRVHREGDGLALETRQGIARCRYLICCGGLQSDRIARMCGVDPGLRIIPFRGEYYELVQSRRHLVRNLIYPVPDPRFPFLGVHFTRMIHGGVEAGPNAVLAFRREGYRRGSFSLGDVLDMMRYRGFWQMARKYWRTGLVEFHRSFSKRAFVHALQALIPEIGMADLRPAEAGVRAQAVEPNGQLVDDFRIIKADRMVHVLNAPSPAATAATSIARYIADAACKHHPELTKRP